ncbi:MAG: hybrid sensor histidine kinase/response regulator [Lunatimonas sp.]|uniref:hybrid sensor histidine kinase/response regulator n=1 Tax=Lunatimonas sp. TaxID=2060141 RepID=UPI00263AE012|nr:hybrid sensor histidine kinase/response regulator [Lunatimonas sp.]MCC5938997.1 hybrid sensor histidine kinase/response regulator [Lunatimonas sp.]
MERKINVLYIDDEDNNLSSFKASLRRDFKIYTASDAEEGLRVATEQEFEVVIADQRMPGMTGVEFFEKLVSVNPLPTRILLTGYSDIASVIDAINKGEVYRFIDKPWNLEQIKNAIINAAEIYEAKKELREKNERLQKLHSEMNQFVYSLSHELRGPLMSISGISKLAKMETSDEGILEYFDMIDSATLKLDDFIYKMLDFYRSTKMENKVESVDFREVFEQQLHDYRAKWNIDDVDIHVEINQDFTFHSDVAKIRVILNNLISNAYKFQKESGTRRIGIKISVAKAQAVLIVSDNGIGIEERHQKDVFNLFHRATQRNVGSGLGLYMVKESVEQMKGTVDLKSIQGSGTTVTVVLPDLVPDS